MIVSIKLHLDAGNDEYNILGNFGVRITSGFEVLEGDVSKLSLSSWKRKEAGLNTVKMINI